MQKNVPTIEENRDTFNSLVRRWKDEMLSPRTRDQAYEELERRYRPMLLRHATRTYRALGGRAPLDDLLSIARLGFFEGCRRYNPDHPTASSAYVVTHVKMKLREALIPSYAVHIPVAARPVILQAHRLECISRPTGSAEEAQHLKRNLGTRIDVDAIQAVRSVVTQSMVTLDAPVDGDDNSKRTISDFLVDHTPGPEELLSRTVTIQRVREAFSVLTERERVCLTTQFDDSEHRTLRSLGEEFGISSERARQIRVHALKKVRKYLEKITDPNDLMYA